MNRGEALKQVPSNFAEKKNVETIVKDLTVLVFTYILKWCVNQTILVQWMCYGNCFQKSHDRPDAIWDYARPKYFFFSCFSLNQIRIQVTLDKLFVW